MTAYAEVIGDPIAQSKSPLIHGFWLGQLGIAAEYRRAHVKPEELAGYFESRRADPDWRGCNITLPHKQAALEFVEDRGGIRQSIGAINTVVRAEDGALIGTNTDAGGFYAPIAGLDLEGRHAVVIGAGGAARAILFALSKVGIGRVTLLNRNVLKGAALLSGFGIKGEALPLLAKLPPAALLVNASALGMVGQPPLEIDLSPLPEDAVVYDAVYAPLETDLLAQARDRDLDTVDGLEMLVGQAALAFELFFGAEPPRDRDAELRALLLTS
ncbi:MULTISPECIES: shikimate dehydrogenase [unclassified Sphingomonas]|uniref:shikimate dehydrogenase n=1 Tax=Sphingomonas TaxID=13687 RepID=UPI00096734C4|nr:MULTISPECIES: shikimate dehydrogenase [unclassified Sphingomonas]MBN8810119.1 shikimate dehydrogenase [Sphingomonas sp.]OJY50701.1 MAG: shikimate dehydrogenase [Sphingomonas sp. 67-41]